MYVCVSKLSAK